METVQPKLNIKRLITSIVILGFIGFLAFKFVYPIGVEFGEIAGKALLK